MQVLISNAHYFNANEYLPVHKYFWKYSSLLFCHAKALVFLTDEFRTRLSWKKTKTKKLVASILAALLYVIIFRCVDSFSQLTAGSPTPLPLFVDEWMFFNQQRKV